MGVPIYLVKRVATAGIGAVGAAIVGNLTGAIERAIDIAFTAGYAARRWGLAFANAATPAARGTS